MAGEFSRLLQGDETEIVKMVKGFERAIERSFSEDKGTRTNDEVRRRFDICARIYRELRGDLKWSLPRIMDNLPRALRCALDGTPWKPDDRRVWTPD